MQEESRQKTPGFPPEADQPPAGTAKKKVDESWKNAVEKEKTSAVSPEPEKAGTLPKPDPEFLYFISGLGMQTLAALGEIPDESGVAGAPDLEQAKRLIDALEMLARKTKGNLVPEEETSFRELLREIRLKFVQRSKEL